MSDLDSPNDSSPSIAALPVCPAQTSRFMATVYAWMGGGLLTTSGTAYALSLAPDTLVLLTHGWPAVLTLVAPFVLCVVLGGWATDMRPSLAAFWYLVFAATMGAWYSATAAKVATDAAFADMVTTALLVTAGMFAGLATWGYTTRRDLAGWGTFLLGCLFGLIIAIVVNIFLQSTPLQFLISSACVLVFSALVTYDVQAAKRSAHMGTGGAIVAALNLYLDFINLFNHVLALLGMGRSED